MMAPRIAASRVHEPRPGAGVTDRLAGFCAGLALDSLPADVVERTKLCVLDSIGTIVAGATTDLGRGVFRAATRFEATGAASVLGMAARTSPPAAALVNGTLSEVFELQDGWRFGNNHPCVVIPAALAVGEWKGASGSDFLAAVVAGYEVTNRLAWAVHPRHLARGYLPTGTAGTCGSTATAGRLLGFDPQRMADALGVAGFLLPVSTAENLWVGYSAKPLHSGWAAKAGIEAALLAEEGFSGCPIEGSPQRGHGFLEITTGDVEFGRILDRLGEHFTVRDVYFKIFPACRHVHGTAQAALDIAQGERFAPEDIERVRVFTYELSASLLDRYTDAESSMIAAQFSIPYVAAAALADRALGTAQFADRRIHDETILALSRKIDVVADPAITAVYPQVTPTRVEVTLRDGRVLRSQVDMPKGDPRMPLDEATLMAKFEELAGMAWQADKVDRVRDAVMQIERFADMRDFVAVLEG
jgi:2-methylcitrate dehydratase PrpD